MSPYGKSSDNEHSRYQIANLIKLVAHKKLTGTEAVKCIMLSLRKVSRLTVQYLEKGATGLVHSKQ